MSMETEKNFARFQFLDHKISELSIKNTIRSYDEDAINERTLDADFNVLQIGAFGEKHVGLLQLYVSTALEMCDDTALSISLLLEGAFACPLADLDDEGFKNMLELNGTSALYSIARSLILSVSSQAMSGINIRIPLMNVVAWHKSKIVNQDEQKEEPTED